MVSPSAEQGLTVNTPGAQTVQLIFPFPGQITPLGQGRVQPDVEPGSDHVLGGAEKV